MIIQKNQLLESLKVCMSAVKSNSNIQGADCFIFHKGRVYCYSDSIAVSTPIKQNDLIEDLEGCVKADEFFKIINKLSDQEIKFNTTEEGNWFLKSGKSKIEMSLIDLDVKSILRAVNPKDDWIDIPEDFIYGIGLCKMSSNKTQVAGIYFSEDQIVSTDGNQMNCYKFENVELPTFWISDNSINELLKLKNIRCLQVQKSWVHFKTEDDVIFSVKTLQSDLYPYEKLNSILNSSDIADATIHANLPKVLFEAIDRAVSFSIDIAKRPAVRLSISKDKINVSSERSSGKFVEKVAWDEQIENDFDPFVIYVDSAMIQSISQKTTEFYFLKDTERLLFVTEKSKHILSTLDENE